MVAAILCREMHWTWDDYMSQPVWFVTILLTMLQAESQEHERRSEPFRGV